MIKREGGWGAKLAESWGLRTTEVGGGMAGVSAVEQHGVLACGGGEQFCAETEARGWRWGKEEGIGRRGVGPASLQPRHGTRVER
jgi:hypothetical protein